MTRRDRPDRRLGESPGQAGASPGGCRRGLGQLRRLGQGTIEVRLLGDFRHVLDVAHRVVLVEYEDGSLQDPATGKPLPNATPEEGAIFAAVKSEHLPVPALLAGNSTAEAPDWTVPPTPMLERILVPDSERDETKLSGTLAKLAETDRGLVVMQEEGTGAQLVCVQGPMHLRDLCKTLAEVNPCTCRSTSANCPERGRTDGLPHPSYSRGRSFRKYL